MYEYLFTISGLATLSWVFMIFLPKWSVTAWTVRTAIFPLATVVCLMIACIFFAFQNGLLFIFELASYEEILRLLQTPELTVIAWILILAFVQLMGRLIYLENMEKKYVPMIAQSMLLALTLFAGPIGYLLYILLSSAVKERRRLFRRRRTSSAQK